jgi:hypothetical protein
MTAFITALAIASVDHAYLLQPGRHESVVGAGLFICDVEDHTVRFDLRVRALDQAAFPGDLIAWLEGAAPEQGLLTAYRLRSHVAPALDRLPIASSAAIMSELNEQSSRAILDLREIGRTGETLPLFEACAALGIPASARDPAERFIDWSFDRIDRVTAALELDAIATFRLALRQFRGGPPHGRRLVQKIEPALRDWLETSECSAALLHRTPSAHS